MRFSPIILSVAAMVFLPGNAPFTIKSKDMVSTAHQLSPSQTVIIRSRHERDMMIAEIKLDQTGQAIADIKMTHDDRILLLPQSAYAEIRGAHVAWLEKRGALATLMFAGRHNDKAWKLTLEFHPKQLWKKRLSVEGIRGDEFTFYDRDDMKPSKPEHRDSMTMGLDL